MLNKNIFKLYCCSDYREYVEAIVELQTEREKPSQIIWEDNKLENKKQSKKARRLAKQRQEQRYLNRSFFKNLYFFKNFFTQKYRT